MRKSFDTLAKWNLYRGGGLSAGERHEFRGLRLAPDVCGFPIMPRSGK